jgi:hypothetical protein
VQEIGRLLPSVIKKQVPHVDPAWIEILRALWPRMVGKAMARQCQPASFASGTLTICTDSRTWATQLRYLAEEIRAEINGFLAQSLVKKLRIKLVPQLELFPPKAVVPAASDCFPAPASPAKGTGLIPDAEIAHIVAKSYAKYFARERR